MSEIITCECGAKVRLPAERSDRAFRCPKCKSVVDASESDPDDLLVLTPDLELNEGGVESPNELLKRWDPREADSSITRRPCPKCLQLLPRKATECRFCGARAVPADDDTIVLWISAEFDHVRLSLKRCLSVAACFLVGIATVAVMLVFLATTSGRIRCTDVALIMLLTVLTPACVVGAIVIWRKHIWPVYGALVLAYVLTALLLMVQPIGALSIGGSVLFYCHRALWLADRLRAQGEPRFDQPAD